MTRQGWGWHSKLWGSDWKTHRGEREERMEIPFRHLAGTNPFQHHFPVSGDWDALSGTARPPFSGETLGHVCEVGSIRSESSLATAAFRAPSTLNHQYSKVAYSGVARPGLLQFQRIAWFPPPVSEGPSQARCCHFSDGLPAFSKPFTQQALAAAQRLARQPPPVGQGLYVPDGQRDGPLFHTVPQPFLHHLAQCVSIA